MSVTVTTDVFCDACPEWTHGVVAGSSRVSEARRVAAARGWSRRRIAGRLVDLCPECAGVADDGYLTADNVGG